MAQAIGKKSDNELMAAFHFTEDDLEANRRNILTDRQRKVIYRSLLESLWPLQSISFKVLASAVIAMPCAALYVDFKGGRVQSEGLLASAVFTFVMLMLIVLVQFAVRGGIR